MKKSINLMLSLIVMTAFMALASCCSDNNSGAGGGGGGNSYPFVGTWVAEGSSPSGPIANTIGYKEKTTVTYSSDGKYQKKEESTITFSTIAYAQAYYNSQVANQMKDDDEEEYYTISGTSVTKTEIDKGTFTYDEKTGIVTITIGQDTKRMKLDVQDGVLTSTTVHSDGSLGTPSKYKTTASNNQSSSNNSQNSSNNDSSASGTGIVGAWGWYYNGILEETFVFCPDGMTMFIVEYRNGAIHDIEEMRYTYNSSNGVFTLQEDSSDKPVVMNATISGNTLSWVDADGDRTVLQRTSLPMSYDDLKKNCRRAFK